MKLENVYSKLALEEIVLNLVGFERFSFVRQLKKNKKEARTHDSDQEIWQRTNKVHESTLKLKRFDDVFKRENRDLEMEFPFQYAVPSGAPSSLEANPTEYCNFEVEYVLEAHLIVSGANKAKKISANQQIQVLGLPNVPVLRNQEYERSFKMKGFMNFLRSSSFTSKAMLATN